MKRQLNMGMALIILLCCLSPPAMAAESVYEDMFFDVLAYGYPNDGSSVNIYGTDSAECYFRLPFVKAVRYVDIIVQVPGVTSGLTAQVGGPAIKRDLTCEVINNTTWRIYGNTSYSSSVFYLYFQASGLTSVIFKSVRVSFDPLDSVMVEGYCEVSSTSFSGTIHYVPTDDINHRQFLAGEVADGNVLTCFLYTEEWTKFDYIDFQLMFICSNINSISCVMGSEIVPCEVSYLEPTIWSETENYITIRIDTRYLDRTVDDYPMVIIEGLLTPSAYNMVSVVNICGYAVSSSGNLLTILFRDLSTKLAGWFGALQTALSGDTTSGDSFKEDVAPEIDSLDKGVAELDKLEKPDLDSALGNVDMSQTQEGLGLVNIILTSTVSSEYFGFIFLLVATLGIISYLLYGRG